ncbi:MAG: hypothetical protein Q8L87_16440 [Anaerolineales bacterium]|nr:hypothetical protein [Anaerolineales bacterium]
MKKRLVIWIIVICVLISTRPALAALPENIASVADPNADPRFGLGVATRTGVGTNAYGNTDINQNGKNAIALMGLYPSAKTWSVYQLESNTDIIYLLASYNNYPQYGNYTGNEWNPVSSSVQGTPGVGTFIVTHIALGGYNNTGPCGSDGYCIYGLSGQPVAWGQDDVQVGGKYLDAPTNFCSIMPKTWRRYFKRPVPAPSCPDGENGDSAYNPRGLINVNKNDIWSSYPNYTTSPNSTINDIRVPSDYWENSGTGGGFIVYGGFYNPKIFYNRDTKTYVVYNEGAFKNFITNNKGKTYALFNFPDATTSKWDKNPVLSESYVSIFKQFLIEGIRPLDTTAKFMVALGSDAFTDPTLNIDGTCYTRGSEFYPQKLVDKWVSNYGSQFPVDYWSYTLYGGLPSVEVHATDITTSSPTYNSKRDEVLHRWAKLAECRTKNLSAVSNGTQVTDIYLNEITVGTVEPFDINGNLPCGPGCSYAWEKEVFYRFGKWVRSLAVAYPKLKYFAIQPTFHIPQYVDGVFVPSTRQDNRSLQVLSTSSTGTAEGWYRAAQPGTTAPYIGDMTNTPPPPGGYRKITVKYYNDANVSGLGEVQLVVNDHAGWNSPYGARVMYVPATWNGFSGPKMYVYNQSGWHGYSVGTEVPVDAYTVKISVSSTSNYIEVTYWLVLPSTWNNYNVYGFAEDNYSTSLYDQYDLSAGNSNKYDFANFKKLGVVQQ